MKKFIKKLLSVLLSVTLTLCLAPVEVYASNTDPYLDGETYYRISNGQYIPFDTNYEKMISYFQSQLSQRKTDAAYYFATKAPEYAYTYSAESDDDESNKISGKLLDDIMNDVFTMDYANPENASLGDYLYHSIISYGQGSSVFLSRYDDPAPGNDRYYTFYIYLTDVKYYTDYNKEMLVENAAKEFSSKYIPSNASDYDKVKTIYDFVVRNTVYDYDVYSGKYSSGTERYNIAHSAFGALYGGIGNTANYDLTSFKAYGGESIIKNAHQGKSVCQGYSKLFYYLCIMNGINCHIVDGDYTENSGKKSDSHEWNYVYLDDDGDGVKEWFQVDTTFASQKSMHAVNINNYDYFLCGSENPAFSEDNHQQPYGKDGYINQLYDWYTGENVSSLHDYNIVKKDVSNYTGLDIVVKRNGVNSVGKVIENYFVIDNNKKLHNVYIGDSNETIGTEALEGFEYNAKTDSFDFYIPYFVPEREYFVTPVSAKEVGNYTISAKGENQSTFNFDFSIIPHNMNNDGDIVLKIGDQSSRVDSNEFKVEASYIGNDYMPNISVEIIDGFGNRLQKDKDYKLLAYKDKALTQPVSEITEIGLYYIDIDYMGNFSGHFPIGFEVGKIDLAKIKPDPEHYNYQYYPEAVLKNNGMTMNQYILDSVVRRRIGSVVIDRDTDYSVTVSGGTDYGDRGKLILTGLKGSEKITQGTKMEIEYSVSKQYDISYLDGKPADSNTKNKYYYTGKRITPKYFDNLDAVLVKGKDYKIVGYGTNVNKGRGYVTIEGINGCTGRATMYFVINGIDISKSNFKYSNLSASNASVKLTYAGKTLKEGTDYTKTLTVGSKGSCTLTVKGKGNYAGTIAVKYKVTTPTSSGNYAKLSATSYTYSGSAKKPSVKVYNKSKHAVDPYYYTVSYSSNTNPGKAKVTIKFRNGYKGSLTYYFTIKPKTMSISSLTASTKAFTVKWKKDSRVTGYQVQYSASSKFSKASTKTITKNSTVSYKASKLSKKKKYYVRIRSYKTVSGKRYYSSWSKSKTIKTK